MTENQIEQIQAFIDGEMEPEERESFRQQLENDEELSAAYDTYRAFETHMVNNKKYASEDAIKSSLSKLGDEFFNIASRSNDSYSQEKEAVVSKTVQSGTLPKKLFWVKNPGVWKLAAAACLALMVMATWYIISNNKNVKDPVATHPKTSIDSIAYHKKSIDTLLYAKKDTGIIKPIIRASDPPDYLNNEQLFARHFKPDPAPKDYEGPLEEAFEEYEKGQSTSAAISFENADLESYDIRGSENDLELNTFYAYYYKALCYMELKNDEKAIQILKNLDGPDPFLQVKVQWYQALAYLRTRSTPEATLLLQAITKNSEAGKYRQKANELMIELRKVR